MPLLWHLLKTELASYRSKNILKFKCSPTKLRPMKKKGLFDLLMILHRRPFIEKAEILDCIMARSAGKAHTLFSALHKF